MKSRKNVLLRFIYKALLLGIFSSTAITSASTPSDNSLDVNTPALKRSLQDTGDSTIVKLTRYEVKDGKQLSFSKALGEYVLRCMAERGNIMAEAYLEKDNPRIMWTIERWENTARMNAFSQSDTAKAITTLQGASQVKPATAFYASDLEPLSKDQWRRSSKPEDHPLTVMLFVEAKEGEGQYFKDIYHKAMPEIRGEKGVITYGLSQLQGTETGFVTYEKFRSQEAFDFHLNFPPILPILDFLKTGIKNPPFKDGLHILTAINSKSGK